MKYTAHLIAALVAVALLGFILPASAQNTLQYQKDSLRRVIEQTEGKDKLKTYAQLYYLYMAEVSDDAKMDTLLTIFRQAEEEAIRQGDKQRQGMIYGNIIISHVNRSEYDKVIEKMPDCLDFYARHNLWRFYYQMYSKLIFAYCTKREYEQAAAEAEKMYARAKAQNNKAGMANALYASGITYNLQKRWKEAEECFRECIRLLWDVSGNDNIFTQAYGYLCVALRAQQRHDDVLQLMPEYEKALARYEKATGCIQPEARGNRYLTLMNTYLDTRRYDMAKPLLAKIEGLVNNNISGYELAKARALIFLAQKDYPAALASIDSAMVFMQTSPTDVNRGRQIKMEILARMGRNDEAFLLLDTLIAVGDSLKNVEVNARFDELRTQYEVARHITEKERNFHYFLFALGISGVLLLLLAGVFYYNRVITAKNRKLYERIKEQDRLAQEFERLSQSHRAPLPSEVAVAELAEMPDASSADSEQQLLVARLREYLLSDMSHAGTDLSRNDITSALSTNRNILNEAVRAVTGRTLMEYMRALQIEEARKMLDHHPELTTESVAFTCGFNTPSTFYRLFKKQYGLTPAEYRKMAKANNK